MTAQLWGIHRAPQRIHRHEREIHEALEEARATGEGLGKCLESARGRGPARNTRNAETDSRWAPDDGNEKLGNFRNQKKRLKVPESVVGLIVDSNDPSRERPSIPTTPTSSHVKTTTHNASN